MAEVKQFTFNPFMENTYVVYDESKECVIIDPGCYTQEERDQLVAYIDDNALKVVKLLNTHCHIDHVFGNAFVKRHWGVDLWIHPKDEETLRAVKVYAPMYGIPNYEEALHDHFLEEGDKVNFGNTSMEVLFVPGHAPGHIAFVLHDEKVCINGDVLFEGSIGRTDLPGGDFNTLIQSIHTKIFPLGDDYKVYTGHGNPTTVGREKMTNPFCALKGS